MNKLLSLSAMLGLALGITSCASNSENDSSPQAPKVEYAPKVKELLGQMTLEEKVGQMTQITLDTVLSNPGNIPPSEPAKLDMAALRKIVVDYNAGSILNTGGQARTLENWNEMMTAIQKMAAEETRLGIPILYGIDAIHGTNYTMGSTLFPQQVGLAATWNPDLVEELAAICAYETKASGIPWNFSPVLDLGIDPRWPRIWEGFGEDPLLSSKMGVAMVEGFEGGGIGEKERVASCLKHFIGYGAPFSGKDRTPAWIPERLFRELFVPPFQATVDAGAATVMINSGEVNGVPVHASADILVKLLRNEMGFKGLAVTDWYDIYNLVERHHIAKDRKEATKLAINAGIDMAMVPYDVEFADYLIELVNEGAVPMSRIDEAVSRILQLKVDLGLFEKTHYAPADFPKFGSEEFAQVAYEGAVESITLLKNENALLPLKEGTKIFVTGPNANSMRPLNGGWSYTWQGERTNEFASDKMTILEALKDRFGEKNVDYEAGVSYKKGGKYHEDEEGNLNKVRRTAKRADVVIACIGENTYTEKPGDLNSLSLSENQKKLIATLKESGTPVVLLLTEGRPRIIREEEQMARAIVHSFLPGNEGGKAIADILIGAENPSGKLPYTYPRYVNDLVPYYHKHSETVPHADGNAYVDPFFNPQFAFGFGLSYTEFAYQNLKLDKTTYAPGETMKVSIEVKNTGSRAGKEVVQLYTSDLVASITPSVKRLRAFKKVSLEAGASQTVTFEVSVKDLAFINLNQKWEVEAGQFKMLVGTQSADFEVSSSKVIGGNGDWRL